MGDSIRKNIKPVANQKHAILDSLFDKFDANLDGYLLQS